MCDVARRGMPPAPGADPAPDAFAELRHEEIAPSQYRQSESEASTSRRCLRESCLRTRCLGTRCLRVCAGGSVWRRTHRRVSQLDRAGRRCAANRRQLGLFPSPATHDPGDARSAARSRMDPAAEWHACRPDASRAESHARLSSKFDAASILAIVREGALSSTVSQATMPCHAMI